MPDAFLAALIGKADLEWLMINSTLTDDTRFHLGGESSFTARHWQLFRRLPKQTGPWSITRPMTARSPA